MKESKKYTFFKWIAPIGVILIFVLIELIVRIFVPPVNSSEIDLGPLIMFTRVEKADGTWYQITGKNNITNRYIEFKEIPDIGVFRVIVLGGSAAAGWPHPSNQTFSYYLEKTLNHINTTRKTEIINCAAHGFASYRVLQVFEQVKKWHPNLIIVWCGNNEFLEERDVWDNFIFQALRKMGMKIRIVQELNKLVLPSTKLGQDVSVNVAGTFWKKTQQEALILRTNEQKFANVRKIYAQSISRIVQEAKEGGIQVMLMTVPVNLRDWQPNVSKLSGSKSDSINWYNHYFNGWGLLLNNQLNSACKEFKLASNIQPEHADTWFWLGKSFENMGDSINAYSCYNLARDFDMNPFRALSSFNDSIRSISSRFKVPLFDAENDLRKYSKRSIPGFDLFLDYVHPSKIGNFYLCFKAAEIINNMPQFNSQIKMSLSPKEIWEWIHDGYFDEFDSKIQLTQFSLCCITHQDRAVVMFGNKLLQLVPPKELENKNSVSLNLVKAGVDAFRTKLIVDQKKYLMVPISKEEKELVNRKMEDFYKTYYPYGSF